jgi:translocation and assembly module TamB
MGENWNATADIKGLTREALSLGLANLVLDGTISTKGTGDVTFDLISKLEGLNLGNEALDAAIGSDMSLTATVRQTGDGPVEIREMQARGAGLAVSGSFDLAGLNEAFEVTGRLSTTTKDMARFSGLLGQPELSGGAQIEVSGSAALLGGTFDGDILARTTDLHTGIASLDSLTKGDGTVSVSARRDTDGLVLREFALATEAVKIAAKGNAATGTTELDFDGWLADASVFVPDWFGPVTAKGRAVQTVDGWQGDLSGTAPDKAEFIATGEWPNGESPTVFLDGRIATVRSFVPDLDGPATLTASFAVAEDGLGLFAEANGPAGTSVTADGFVAFDGVVGDLSLTGTLPVGLANRQLRPNSIQGMARFDLVVDGPLQAQSVRGTITANSLRLSLPAQRNALEGIDASVNLRDGAGQVDVKGTVATGGSVRAQGQLSLVAPIRIGMDIQLEQIIARDPELYETVVSGPMRLEGPLFATPLLSGALALERTELRIPSASIFGAELMAGVSHLGDTPAMRRTRDAAGMSPEAELDTSGGASIGLDITIDGNNRIFLRGRGLDAEMGGRLRLSGSTADIVPDGEFQLIRGRLDILGKRLDLEEGSAQLRGGLIPTIRLVAQTTTDELVIRVIVEGPADAPEVRFVSERSLPDDEILAQLLFGRGITSLSALQAVQLGSAIATLAGRGGDGILERLRQNAGVDDLDVTTDEGGNATLRAGKYISENVYSDVSVNSQGGSSVTINLDLSPSTTVRGALDSDGRTAIGIYFEKDY